MKITAAIKSQDGFLSFFKDGLESWSSWMTLFKVLDGEPLTAGEMGLYSECTGRSEVPAAGSIRELWISAGRKSGKSTASALLAATLSLWGGWEKYLSKGERARIFIVSPTMAQGQIVKQYLDALFSLNASLRGMVRRSLSESIELTNGNIIEIHSASWRSSRGFSCGLLILEEVAYLRFESDSAMVDKQIYTALAPSMTTIRNSLIVGISSPFVAQGLLFEKFNKHWGERSPVLCWHGKSWQMNLTLTEQRLRDEFFDELGEDEFAGEYEARWREGLQTYLPLEAINDAVVEGRNFLDYQPGVSYFAFADPAEGLRKNADSMAFAVAHAIGEGESKKYILDFLAEFMPPFDPAEVLRQIAATCQLFHIRKIVQDRHALGWIAADLKPFNIEVEVSNLTKTQIYESFGVLMSKRRTELLDDPKLIAQMKNLMKSLKSGGSVSIDCLGGRGHDDVINVVG